MRFWLSDPRIGWFRPNVSFGPEDFRRKRRPVAPPEVIEPAVSYIAPDPIDRLYDAFLRLDRAQRSRFHKLIWRDRR